jgi:hypothetical protein
VPYPYAPGRVHRKILFGALLSTLVGGCAPRTNGPSADPEPEQRKPAALVVPSAPLPESPRDLSKPGAAVSVSPASDHEVVEASDACRRAMDRVLRAPGLPGAPGLEKSRPLVLLYAKAEPVVFVEKPSVDRTSSPEAVRYRAMLEDTDSPWSRLQALWTLFSAKPDLGRSVLLRDGYLYAEKPQLAFALVDLVSAQTLFSASSPPSAPRAATTSTQTVPNGVSACGSFCSIASAPALRPFRCIATFGRCARDSASIGPTCAT